MVLIDISRILREHGLRVTPQRELIFKVLQESRAHPSVELLFEKVKESYPALSLNTIYTTLDLFERKGLIKKFNVGANIFRYDADTRTHAHVICTECGRVDDINGTIADLIKSIPGEVESRSSFAIKYGELNLFGVCPDCGGREKRDSV